MLRLGILGSTRGTDMLAIITAIREKRLQAEIAVVISNKQDAGILERAKQHDIPVVFVDPHHTTRETYDEKVSNILQQYKVDLVILIGYMRILSDTFVAAWRNKVINVHPSLLPAFAGGMDNNVHQAILEAGVTETGCTVHYVTEEVDAGPILLQKKCPILPGDTVETLKARVQQLEGEALVEVLTPLEKKRCLKRALLSVSDKTGIVEFATALIKHQIEIISTGGTSKLLREHDIPVRDVSEVTHFPEMMDGRVKTLHPKIHGGILGLRDQHAEIAAKHDITWIDLVVVNLYPFAETIKKPNTSFDEAIENIDIGGPAMIRSAAKNMQWVSVVVDPKDYSQIIQELNQYHAITEQTRKNLAAKAFKHTAQYDALISTYLDKNYLALSAEKTGELRYGENPQQSASAYCFSDEIGILTAKQYQGKQLSYNNIMDADAAVACVREFRKPACVIVKHANPCGVAVANSIEAAFPQAFAADSTSAFGGIVALNSSCTQDVAKKISALFFEVIIAPEFSKEALALFAAKPNLRILVLDFSKLSQTPEIKSVTGGLLIQDRDTSIIEKQDLTCVTQIKPSESEIEDMLFAWKVVKHIKSNAILIAKRQMTVGVGAGQVSRIDAVHLAITKAGQNIVGAVLASDAFFPFRDSIDVIAKAGIRAIIQPGGSMRDEEVIAACNEHKIAMVFTGKRCFKH